MEFRLVNLLISFLNFPKILLVESDNCSHANIDTMNMVNDQKMNWNLNVYKMHLFKPSKSPSK